MRMDLPHPYPEPTQVPRVSSPRRVGENLSEGIRQISSVSLVEGMPAVLSKDGVAGRSDKGVPAV